MKKKEKNKNLVKGLSKKKSIQKKIQSSVILLLTIFLLASGGINLYMSGSPGK